MSRSLQTGGGARNRNNRGDDDDECGEYCDEIEKMKAFLKQRDEKMVDTASEALHKLSKILADAKTFVDSSRDGGANRSAGRGTSIGNQPADRNPTVPPRKTPWEMCPALPDLWNELAESEARTKQLLTQVLKQVDNVNDYIQQLNSGVNADRNFNKNDQLRRGAQWNNQASRGQGYGGTYPSGSQGGPQSKRDNTKIFLEEPQVGSSGATLGGILQLDDFQRRGTQGRPILAGMTGSLADQRPGIPLSDRGSEQPLWSHIGPTSESNQEGQMGTSSFREKPRGPTHRLGLAEGSGGSIGRGVAFLPHQDQDPGPLNKPGLAVGSSKRGMEPYSQVKSGQELKPAIHPRDQISRSPQSLKQIQFDCVPCDDVKILRDHVIDNDQRVKQAIIAATGELSNLLQNIYSVGEKYLGPHALPRVRQWTNDEIDAMVKKSRQHLPVPNFSVTSCSALTELWEKMSKNDFDMRNGMIALSIVAQQVTQIAEKWSELMNQSK